ncbi:MAG TPA: TonB family protein [Myxococcota bacterium]|nr:TonB family protein [Myxococcota bacterium]
MRRRSLVNRVAGVGLIAALGTTASLRADELAAAPPHERSAKVIVDAIAHGPSVDARLEEIRRRIQGNLAYPPLARWHDVAGAAVVEFEVTDEGRTRGVRLAQSSGTTLLDNAAEHAVTSVTGLPVVHGRLSIPIRFELTGGE